VCVKLVPDSAAQVVVDGGQVTWGEGPLVINPWDEYAVEAALRLTEAQGGEVTVITVGGEQSKDALRHALAMGCSQAILVQDPALENGDSQAIARVLAAAIQKVGEVEAAFFGKQAIDGDMGVTAAMTARVLGWAPLTNASAIEVGSGSLKVMRATEEGRQVVEAKLPAVVNVIKDYGEPRYPSFMGIRKASRAEIPVWSLADLGLAAPASFVTWPVVMNPPARDVQTEIISGDSPEDIAAKLADAIMREKVL
jgi:electron transfer flavoprotein beta subunit